MREPFKAGKLACQVGTCDSEQLWQRLKGTWDNGYLAFSNREILYADLPAGRLSAALLRDRVTDLEGIEGYLMEIDLWRNCDGRLEELVAERADCGWQVQQWTLRTDVAEDEGNCWYRPAATRPGGHHHGRELFEQLSTIEVVWPERRLNIFLGRG